MGHEDPFPRPGPNGRCRFGQETFAGVRSNRRDAPRAAIPAIRGERSPRRIYLYQRFRGLYATYGT